MKSKYKYRRSKYQYKYNYKRCKYKYLYMRSKYQYKYKHDGANINTLYELPGDDQNVVATGLQLVCQGLSKTRDNFVNWT